MLSLVTLFMNSAAPSFLDSRMVLLYLVVSVFSFWSVASFGSSLYCRLDCLTFLTPDRHRLLYQKEGLGLGGFGCSVRLEASVRADLGGHLKYSRRWSGVRAGVLLGAQGAVRRGENRGGL